MTPMVDLAFLLLTFFMLTTTFAKPVVMPIAMPVKPTDAPPPIKESDALTIYLGPSNQVYYLDGLADGKAAARIEKSDFSDSGIRQHILQRRKENVVANKGKEKLFVLIKPLKDSRYKNMVDILDEMSITGTERYALLKDFTAGEKTLLQKQIGIAF